jgi:hypothetical protein
MALQSEHGASPRADASDTALSLRVPFDGLGAELDDADVAPADAQATTATSVLRVTAERTARTIWAGRMRLRVELS